MSRLLPLLLCAALAAHQFHYSRTEINWNSASRTLEIIATLHADDIEFELRKSRPQIELDRDKESEPLVCAYTAKALGLTAKCIGIKVSRDYVDVFLETSAAAPPSSLTNRILIEDRPGQRNDVELKRDGKRLGPRIQFNTSETRKALRW